MPRLISKKFNIHNAKQFLEAFNESDPTQFYLFYSRINPWPSEANPPTPIDTVQYTDYDVWRGMIGLKKVSNNNISLAVPRYDWASNTIYTQYTDDNPNLFSNTFFVFTEDFNVYKCMFNNREARSTVKPSGTSTSVITTSDGYKWKFMYSITNADLQRYLTENHIPVKTIATDDSSPQFAVQQAASNGSLLIYDVTANGTGYLTNSGTVVAAVNSTVITLASSASGTDKVYNGSTLFIDSGLGTGQIRDIIQYSGVTKRATLNTALTVVPNTSSTYLVGPKINISGDGTGALAYANVVSGQVKKITSINGGSNYSRAQVSITANTSFGSGATAKVYLSPPGGHGSDPIYELGGSSIILNVKVDGTESGKITANNDFRVYGLITDPVLANGSIATGTRYNQTTELSLTSVSGTFSEDEFVNGDTSTAKGRIVQFANTNGAGTTGILRITDVEGSYTNNESITANTSGVTGTINGITQPELTKFTGKLLYTVNRTSLDRDTEQTEDVKITVKF